jgi:hypothetical protein
MFRAYMAIFRHFSCKDPNALRTNRIFVLCSSSYLILVCGHLYFAGVSFSCVRVLGVPCVLTSLFLPLILLRRDSFVIQTFCFLFVFKLSNMDSTEDHLAS